MRDEGGRMKSLLFKLEAFISKSHTFILYPSAFILAFLAETAGVEPARDSKSRRLSKPLPDQLGDASFVHKILVNQKLEEGAGFELARA
jgi:hypothetical protein